MLYQKLITRTKIISNMTRFQYNKITCSNYKSCANVTIEIDCRSFPNLEINDVLRKVTERAFVVVYWARRN